MVQMLCIGAVVNRTPALPLSKIAVQEEHLASSLLHTTESTNPFRRPHEREKTNRLYATFCRASSRVWDDAYERSALRAACRAIRATAVSNSAARSGASTTAAT